jgi:hypothetical protein
MVGEKILTRATAFRSAPVFSSIKIVGCAPEWSDF